MIIELSDLFIVVLYFLLAINEFIFIYFIAGYFTQNFKIRIICGTASPFIFIIIGFPFKLFGNLNDISYLYFLIFIFNLYFLLKNYKFFSLGFKKDKLNLISPYILSIIFMFFYLAYDASKHLTYGFLDTIPTHLWILDAMSKPSSGYQPGIAIYLSPIYSLTNPKGSLDFLAVAMSTTFICYVMLALETLKSKLGLIFVGLMSLHFFADNQQMLMEFSNNQFSILYITLILILVYRLQERTENRKISLTLLILILMSLGITSPSLALYIFYYLFVLMVLLPTIFQYDAKILLITTSALITGVWFYFLNTRMDFTNFISFINSLHGLPVVEQNLTIPTKITDLTAINDFFVFSIIYEIMIEIFKIKVIEHPFISLFNFAGYLSLIGFIFCFLLSLVRRNTLYFLLSTAGLIFGISTLTGIGQSSFIMGRVGLYYIIVFLIFISLVILKVYDFAFKAKYIIFYVGAIFFYASFNPPMAYRYHDEQVFLNLFEYIKNSNQEKIYLISSIPNIEVFEYKDNRVQIIQFFSENNNLVLDKSYPLFVVIDKKDELPDPILSQRVKKEFITDKITLDSFYNERKKIIDENILLEQQLEIRDFKYIFKNSDYSILTNESGSRLIE